MHTARFRKIVLPIYKCPMPGGQNLIDDFEKWVNGVNINVELEDYEHQAARSRTESLKAILPDYLKTLV